jgi:hypothetical protein
MPKGLTIKHIQMCNQGESMLKDRSSRKPLVVM